MTKSIPPGTELTEPIDIGVLAYSECIYVSLMYYGNEIEDTYEMQTNGKVKYTMHDSGYVTQYAIPEALDMINTAILDPDSTVVYY